MRTLFGIAILSAVIACGQEHGAAPKAAEPVGDATGHAQAPMQPSASAGQEHAQTATKHGEGHEDAPMPHEIWWKWANFALLAGGLGYVIAKNAGPFSDRALRKFRKEFAMPPRCERTQKPEQRRSRRGLPTSLLKWKRCG